MIILILLLQNGLAFRVTKYNVANGIANINIVIDIAFGLAKLKLKIYFAGQFSKY